MFTVSQHPSQAFALVALCLLVTPTSGCGDDGSPPGPTDSGAADSAAGDGTVPPGDSTVPPGDSGMPRDGGTTEDGATPVDAGPDTGTPMGAYCTDDSGCDDGSSCTTDTCTDGVCIHSASGDCPWPAESTSDATNLTSVGGSTFDNEFDSDLSGALWNPVHRTLWLCRNNGPSAVWAVVEDGAGGYRIDTRGGSAAAWEDFADAEGVAQADFDDDGTLYVVSESPAAITEYDLSVGGTKTIVNQWILRAEIAGSGSEGLTFVPDEFLSAQGFVDASGTPYVSAGGMGGLFFVGHQSAGQLYVFDMNRTTGGYTFVGEYQTGGDETAGLEFDRSTGQLFIWHDSSIDQIEVVRLSSTVAAGGRRMDTIVTYDGPELITLMSNNIEGIAVKPIEDCTAAGKRDLFLTIDGGRIWSLFLYSDFPC